MLVIKRIFNTILLSLMLSSGVKAALVTFEELPLTVVDANDINACGGGGLCPQSLVTPQGFVFDFIDVDNAGPVASGLLITAGGPSGNYLQAGAAFELNAGIRISHQSGAAFSVQSMDVLLQNFVTEYELTPSGPVFSATTPIEIAGFDQLGNEIATLSIVPPGGEHSAYWTGVSFNAVWSSVYSMTISDQTISSVFGSSPRSAVIDNFSATVVPVPAAVWLFGSGLGLLGWFRRKGAAA